MAGSRSEKISLSPEMLRWARKRARLDTEELAAKLKVRPDQVAAWEKDGEIGIQLIDKLAEQTFTPFGYFFLSKPPYNAIKVADFRTVGGSRLHEASSELFATIMSMLRRQDWAREARIEQGDSRLDYVSSCDVKHASSDRAAAKLREVLHLEPGWQVGLSVRRARVKLFEHMEDAGIFTVINGVVDNNTRHKLDPKEFRGFALVDEYAPLVFVNGRDTISAQMFTLAHESAHILFGKSGVSLCDLRGQLQRIEKVCNSVAAEFLVPASMFKRDPLQDAERDTFIENAAKRFCVSRPVIAHRAHVLKMLTREGLEKFYMQYDIDRAEASKSPKAGGSFWSKQKFRIGDKFGDSVVRAVISGKMPHTEGWSLTGLNRATFDKYVELRREYL